MAKTMIAIVLSFLLIGPSTSFAIDQRQAAEMLPITITSIDHPKENGYMKLMKIHYQIENKGTKDIDAIKAAIVFENPDGGVFQALTADSMKIKAGEKGKADFGYGFDESRFDDNKLRKLGTKMKTWLRVEELIYSDGTFEAVAK